MTDGPVPLDRAKPLARRDGIALWRQITQEIEGDIATGAHAAGARLPTEAALVARYGVNRHTVRRAMEELESRGLVRIEQGRGSFVAEDVLDYRLGARTRFSEIIRRQNREPGGRILRIEDIPAEPALAETLGLRRGAAVVQVERLALADGRPVVLGTHHFPLPRFARLPGLLGVDPSITAALAACGVPDYRRRVTRITARLPTPEEAELLQQSRNRPVLVAEAVNTDPTGAVVDVTNARYAAGRVQLVVESLNPMDWLIAGGEALLESRVRRADVALSDGAFVPRAVPDARRFDATGLLVMPGLVDIHGDAHERQMQPRPGIGFPAALAMRDTAAQLLAAGITTAFLGVTLSWEPGLRGIEAWRATLAAVDAERHRTACDLRIHCRFEADNLDALEEVLADIAAGRVHLLAYNDHTPAILRRLGDAAQLAKYAGRAGMAPAAFGALAESVAARRPEVPGAQARLSAAARAAGIPMLSHDDETPAMRAAFRALGATVCEFPMAESVAEAARAAGEHVVMGAPNVVRGGSHLGWSSAAPLAERGMVSVLASDYYWPAMLEAAFAMEARGAMALGAAWALVSANPAAAARLPDRGRIAPGLRGDLVLVDPAARRPVATFAGGHLAWLSPEGAARL